MQEGKAERQVCHEPQQLCFFPAPSAEGTCCTHFWVLRFITARQEKMAHMLTVLILLINKLPSCLITKPLIILTVLFKICGSFVHSKQARNILT